MCRSVTFTNKATDHIKHYMATKNFFLILTFHLTDYIVSPDSIFTLCQFIGTSEDGLLVLDVSIYITINAYSLYGFLIIIIKSFHGIICRQRFSVMVKFRFLFMLSTNTLLYFQAHLRIARRPAIELAILRCVTSEYISHLEATSSNTSSKSLNSPVDSLSSIPTLRREVSVLLHSVTLSL